MSRFISEGLRSKRRRAVVAVQVLVMLTVLLGFSAFTVDIGTLYRARAELQRAADSAAMAGASAYTTDMMMQVRQADDDWGVFGEVLNAITTRGSEFAGLNSTLGSPTLIESGDIITGCIDVTSRTAPINTAASPTQHNAVQVIARRTEDGSNGPVEFFFAPIFGKLAGEASASAVAVYDDRFAGYDLDSNGAGALPFTIDKDVFAAYLLSGDDDYGYDGDGDSVTSGADGIREINLYPHDVAPGNFGLLNIGTPNQGVPALREQIENGVSPEDMEAEVGTSALVFYEDDGSPINYQITGNPGMKTALESSVEQRVGQVVSFFLHDDATGTGANLVYNIVDIRFGRVMDVRLNGPSTQRGIWIQPVSYNGAGILLSSGAPASAGMAGKVVLAR